MIELAKKAIRYCQMLAACSEEPGRITRTFLSPPMREVHAILGGWMREVGMQVCVDAAGNLRGMLPGKSLKRLVIGSHLDTVPNAGAYDGILGVVMGVGIGEALGAGNAAWTIEVIGFSEEEGVRFGAPFIGSRAVAGTLDETVLQSGVMGAIRAFGLNPDDLPAARMDRDTAAYLEFHIEQGPVLESFDLPLGIVDAIAGQSRLQFSFTGKANHAGTTPMPLRRDALTAAAEWICRVENLAIRTPGLAATTGSIDVEPNASNVIAGAARVTLDVRHTCDETRRAAVAELIAAAAEICGRRWLECHHEGRLDQAAVEMDLELRNALEDSVLAAAYPVHHMISGAGHDAMILAPHVPSAMLFVRSPGGISHHPDESVMAADVAAALDVGVRFVRWLT